MSAADPAPTPHQIMNAPGDAAVIDITMRAARRRTGHRRGDEVSDIAPAGPDTPGPRPTGPRDALTALAERYEEAFNERGLSLTDDRTAATYKVTLQLVQGLLDGAKAQEIVDAGQHSELSTMVQGVMDAPDLVSTAE